MQMRPGIKTKGTPGQHSPEEAALLAKNTGQLVGANLKLTAKKDAICQVLQLTARIVCNRYVVVKYVDSPGGSLANAPGWTDGTTIFLNVAVVDNLLAVKSFQEVVLLLKGLNLHEMCHIIRTPREGDQPTKSILYEAKKGDQALWWAFNALEDQRIESQFTADFDPASVYFQALALQWLIGDTSLYAKAFALVHGRKFLPLQVRQACRAEFEKHYGVAPAKDIAAIIDAYIVLVFPRDALKAVTLIKKLSKIIKRVWPAQPLPPIGTDGGHAVPGSTGAEAQITKGRTYEQDQQAGADKVKKQVKEEKKAEKAEQKKKQDKQDGPVEQVPAGGDDEPTDTDTDAPTAPGGSKGDKSGDSGDGEGGDGDGQGDGATDGDGEGDGAGKGDTPDDAAASAAGGAGSGEAAGPGVEQQGQFDGLDDLLKKALDDVLAGQELQQDVNETVKSIRATAKGDVDSASGYGEHTLVPAPTHSVHAQKRIIKSLQTIQIELEPSWLRQQSVGRVNMRRVAQRKADPTVIDVFDRWDEGSEDSASTEVVILLDVSGSMGHSPNRSATPIDMASDALWVLKSALDKCAIPTTVIGFSSGTETLYKKKERAHNGKVKRFKSHGGTAPYEAIVQANRILMNSQATNKVFVCITDGDWMWSGNADNPESQIALMRKLGVLTVLFGMDCAVSQHGDHYCELAQDVFTPEQCIELVHRMVQELVARALDKNG